jgi:hypothetical protein
MDHYPKQALAEKRLLISIYVPEMLLCATDFDVEKAAI